MLQRLTIAGAVSALMVLALSGMAFAQEGTRYTADLAPLNDSGASGTAMVWVDGNELKVRVEGEGLFTGPHAQHIHIGGQNVCPDMSAAGEDGVLTTPEGADAYGGVQVSLTTEGDVSADSAVAVARFPTANDSGSLTYERTFQLPDGVSADSIANGVIVVHGVDLNDSGSYDGDEMSELDPSLPREATVPALCGALSEAEMPDSSTAPAQTGAPAAWLLAVLLAGGAVAFGALRLSPALRRR